MRLLLDTHVLLWLSEGNKTLKRTAIQRIESRARTDGLAVSGISFWEVAMLAQHGRVSLTCPVPSWRDTVLDLPGMREVPVSGTIGIEAAELPGEVHGDPADRILAATTRVERLELATRDRRLLDYAEAGHIRAIEV